VLGTFFEILDRAFGLRMMAGSGGELAVAHLAQLAAQRLDGDREPELLKHPLRQINQPPAHDAMDRRRRPFFDYFHQRRAMRVIELGRLAGSLAIDEAVGAMRVEFDHPIADDLQRHIADLRGLAARRPVINRGEGEKSSRLRRILGFLRKKT
jgi:hypothetical protein